MKPPAGSSATLSLGLACVLVLAGGIAIRARTINWDRLFGFEPSPGHGECYGARVRIREAAKAVDLFKLEKRRLPISFQEVVDERFMERAPVDPWGRPFLLRVGDEYPKGYTVGGLGAPDDAREIRLHTLESGGL